MDHIVIINEDGEKTMDCRSQMYVVVAICPDDREAWTRVKMVAAGGVRDALLDPMHLAAKTLLAGESVYTGVAAAMENSGFEMFRPKELLETMKTMILEREAEEKANAE